MKKKAKPYFLEKYITFGPFLVIYRRGYAVFRSMMEQQNVEIIKYVNNNKNKEKALYWYFNVMLILCQCVLDFCTINTVNR